MCFSGSLPNVFICVILFSENKYDDDDNDDGMYRRPLDVYPCRKIYIAFIVYAVYLHLIHSIAYIVLLYYIIF